MGSMSLWHWLVVAAIVVLLFGRGKISGVMGEFAQGIKAFKKGMSEEDEKKDVALDAKPIQDQTAQPNVGVKPEQKVG